MERGTPEEILGMTFQLYDINGNGTIEMRELSEILQVSSIWGTYTVASPAIWGTGPHAPRNKILATPLHLCIFSREQLKQISNFLLSNPFPSISSHPILPASLPSHVKRGPSESFF
jgi:hypothetical protein